MRLLELGLLRYGGFADERLDFSAPGLHLIHGENEAGKSTALRAIVGLLYGMKEATRDDYRHRDELRLRGSVRSSDGRELAFERRRGNKNTLRTLADEPLDEHVLGSFLFGITRERFLTAFGLDHVRLRAGGQELAKGEGEAGPTLFDADVGGGSVRQLLSALREEAETLFNANPRARNPQINQALRDLAEQQKRVRELCTRPTAWAERKRELERLREERKAHDQRHAELSAAHARAQRVQQALPLLAKRAAILEQLGPVAQAPLMPEDSSARRLGAEKELVSAAHEERRLREEAQELDARLAALAVPEELGSLDDARIDDLNERLGSYRGHRADLEKRRAELRAHETRIASLLRDLGRKEVGDPRQLVPARARVARIRELSRDYVRLSAEVAEAERRVTEQRAAVAEREAESGAQAAAVELGPELGARADVWSLPVPSLESVEEFEVAYRKSDEARERADEQREAQARSAAQAASELDALRREGEVPTEAELEQARARRDAGWQLVRAAWRDGADVTDDAKRWDPSRPLADGFEAALRDTDELGDRLRREAARVARRAELEAKLAAAREELERMQARRDALTAERGELERRWLRAWVPAGLEPGSPRVMRAALGKLAAAKERRAELSRALERERGVLAASEAERTVRASAVDRWRVAWGEAIAELGLTAGAAPIEAEQVLDVLTELGTALGELDSLRHRIEGMDQSTRSFAAEVALLLAQHAPELATREPGDGCAELIRLQREARVAERGRAELTARRARIDTDLGELAKRRDAAEAELGLLIKLAAVARPEELAEAEHASATRRRRESELVEVEQALAQLASGTSVDALAERAAATTPDDARATVERSAAELASVEDARLELATRVGAAERDLAGLDTESAAADAQAEAELVLARIRAHAERWARVHVAALVLEREIERYRAAHQGPLLGRSSELFRRLTLGAYTAVRADLDASDRPVLVCVQPDGSRVEVERLSDGARDQLYLALRLASLEHAASVSEPLPLVLDDVLVQFDETRVPAALEVLSELSERVQILLFTHHQHVVRAAEQTLAQGSVTLHELVRR